ncbi:hypothetical protein LCGC14_2299300 [marine sediment metagenome]|uniref:Uncharacterized protein n=1 Tax=marine sediment metagenome TaxID=412755 RepID=A0A0F9FIX5_9ZZZZ
MKICHCEPAQGPFELKFAIPSKGYLKLEENYDTLIECQLCHGIYRPAHNSHRGSGTRDDCEFCMEFVRQNGEAQEG